MKDRDFLIWLHERLEHVHKENPLLDSMHKLRAIIRDMPKDKESLSTNTGNQLKDVV